MGRPAATWCLFVLLWTAPLAGHISVPGGLHETVAGAALIVRGRVSDIRVEDLPGVGVETVVTVAVEGVLKGEAGPFVSFRVPGGRIGRYAVVMVGSPTFTRGEHAIFFLGRGDDQFFRPIGLGAGIVRIRSSARRGSAVVQAPLPSAPQTPARRAVRGERRQAPLPVGTFEALVRLIDLDQRRAVGASR